MCRTAGRRGILRRLIRVRVGAAGHNLGQRMPKQGVPMANDARTQSIVA